MKLWSVGRKTLLLFWEQRGSLVCSPFPERRLSIAMWEVCEIPVLCVRVNTWVLLIPLFLLGERIGVTSVWSQSWNTCLSLVLLLNCTYFIYISSRGQELVFHIDVWSFSLFIWLTHLEGSLACWAPCVIWLLILCQMYRWQRFPHSMDLPFSLLTIFFILQKICGFI
jgi:hypothetical protein